MSKTVLTIDDSKTVRMIVNRHLAPFGIQTIDAENGEAGIARAKESNPNVILLDYNMPVMDGYQALVELRSDPDLKQIPVIMLTTETVKDTVIRLDEARVERLHCQTFHARASAAKAQSNPGAL